MSFLVLIQELNICTDIFIYLFNYKFSLFFKILKFLFDL